MTAPSRRHEYAALFGLTPRARTWPAESQTVDELAQTARRQGAFRVGSPQAPADLLRMWGTKMIKEMPFKLLAVAVANKLARIAFAIMRNKTTDREMLA
jgi:transposase